MANRILIVDDEPLFARNLGSYLGRMGLLARTASSADRAEELLDTETFEAVCLDINLPDGHGLDLLRDLRAIWPDLPVVVMSGEDCKLNRVRAQALGAAEFLVKPFPMRELCASVMRLIGHVPPPARARRSRTRGAARGPVVMMYSHDGFGLGHLRRNLNIASRFTREVPGASVLMLVGSPSAELLELPEGVDILKLPSIVKVGTNDWRPRRLQLSSESARDLRSRLILRAAESLCPDLLLVDHLPTGVWGELMPTLRMFRRLATPPHVILGLRDILDDPLTVRESWSRSGVYEVISELYDEVFIYGRPEVYDTARHYGLDVLDDSAVRYCGYVYSEQEPANAEQVRRELAADGQRLVLVTGGGGQDAFPMMQASLDALSCLNPAERPRMALITGPLMDADKREILGARARELSAHVLGCVSNSIDYLAAADVVVTMAGYNTVQEALRLGKRVVVIPRRGPSAEQRIRSVNLTRLGLVTCIDPDTLRARDIARALTARSKAPPGSVTALGGNGVTDAVAAMRARLAGRSRSRPTPLPGRGIYLPEVAAC